MAAAVEELTCADGKLSRLGVVASTLMRGSSGRGRRTIRLSTTAVACATRTDRVACIQSRRRRPFEAIAPIPPKSNQPRACSPTRDRTPAVRTRGPVAKVRWMAYRADVSTCRSLVRRRPLPAHHRHCVPDQLVGSSRITAIDPVDGE